MPSETTLNAANLARLGAERLAALLIEVTDSDAAAKRRLRLELLHRGGGDVAGEIRKRLASIARSRSFVDWRKVGMLARDLDAQREAIAAHVAPTNPGAAFDLLWRLLELAPSVYERCDDSNGMIGDVIASTRDDLGALAAAAGQPADALADRVFAALCDNGYGQFDGLIGLMAEALGPAGLVRLRAQFEALANTSPPPPPGERRIVAISARGVVHQDDLDRSHHARLVRYALTNIADALGDVDAYAARYSDEEWTNPAIAAAIAERMLDAGRPAEALAVLDGAAGAIGGDRSWPDGQRVRIDALDALGRTDDAQAERWQAFEHGLDAGHLRAHLKRLPDFEGIEAEERALALASLHPQFAQALAFLLEWPAVDRAARLILARAGDIDGDYYWLLTPAADAVEQRHPLAATLALRAMIGFSLDAGRYKRYGHAARHLGTCGHLAGRIDDWAGHTQHDEYVADLRRRHGRKSGFWDAGLRSTSATFRPPPRLR